MMLFNPLFASFGQLIYLTICLVNPVQSIYPCGLPQCETCLSTQVYDAPGIGFDLTPFYGTAAVHYPNGTVVQVAQIDADPDYVALMMELVNPPPQPPTDHWERLLSWIDWKLRQLVDDYAEPPRYSPLERWRRWWNKRNGQPATVKASIVGSLLQTLKDATEEIIGQPIDRVAFTSPSLAGLMTDDVNDALEFLGLGSWIDDSDYYPDLILEADAVYAANGHGLCNDYHNLFECWDEFEGQFAPEILFISFSRHLLYTAIFRPDQGIALSKSYGKHDIQSLDFGAGLYNLTQGNIPPAAFWDRVHQHILGLPWEYPLTHVLLAGENASHDQFRAVVVDALAELGTRFPQNNAQDYKSFSATMNTITAGTVVDPTFAAARGAALYARRRQEVQRDCTESTRCESHREEQRKKGPEHVQEKVQDKASAFDNHWLESEGSRVIADTTSNTSAASDDVRLPGPDIGSRDELPDRPFAGCGQKPSCANSICETPSASEGPVT